MNETEAEAYLKFKKEHQIGDIISLKTSICKTMLHTAFNKELINSDIVNIKIDYIGNYGFAGTIVGGIDDKYIGKPVSISYIKYAMNKL